MQTHPQSLPSVFVGRERELGLVRSRLDAAIAGHGGVVLLAGEAGIGKTRLAEELADGARRRGARILWGRCHEGEGAPAFWPWIQILRAYAQDAGPKMLREDFGRGAGVIAQLVPDLQETASGGANPPAVESLDPAAARFASSTTSPLVSSALPAGDRWC